ncbi:uncharacterized protein B0J16DRAFT_151878 [Fusarium flagelliforme]|uniref:Uncharacterized protein n=1 Tax=Fusarium flagelliforme TaxID=2675880 RepID=A0A395M7V6_9HYPO|nr:uncharacterized protein B0J16DRAFT_151878 [Fusarium flagelliforme]KAH7182717.1 hypothetical protein B0J16DRAFT_151878 [Fusarium flagelliforme]RFN43940.1 hypothetical protein FIE12Z_11847 [Fusarium flagelliforme]
MEPFSEQEKRQLLIELIKHSPIDNYTLYRVIGLSSIAPNWFHVALPNGRTVAQCQAALMHIRNEMSESGLKRKAPGEEPSSERSNSVQSSGSQESHAQPQTTAAPSVQMNNQRAPNMPLKPQQHQYQPGPPPKKKGRPPYANRNADQRPFNPRLLAPMPPQPVLQNAQVSFRPIAPAPQLHPGTIPTVVLATVRTPNMEQQGEMGIPTPPTSMAIQERARHTVEQKRLPASSQPPEQDLSRPRSNSEAFSTPLKQEITEQDQPRSVELLETKDQNDASEKESSDQEGREGNGTTNGNKKVRRSRRKT